MSVFPLRNGIEPFPVRIFRFVAFVKSLSKRRKRLWRTLCATSTATNTEGEHGNLETKLETVKEALAAIKNAVKAADEIGKLSSVDDVKLGDREDEEAKNGGSPGTGDNSNIALWIALLFVSGGAIVGAAATGKKKKRSVR